VIVDAEGFAVFVRRLMITGVDTVIMDDGFQQWGIKKDLDIVAIGAANPLATAILLPRGILRQPLSSLKNADVFVLTKTT